MSPRIARPFVQKLAAGLTLTILLGVAPRADVSHSITAPGSPAAIAPDENPTARLSPEVRLRKLHLVRPDLIPYPLAVDVYC